MAINTFSYEIFTEIFCSSFKAAITLSTIVIDSQNNYLKCTILGSPLNAWKINFPENWRGCWESKPLSGGIFHNPLNLNHAYSLGILEKRVKKDREKFPFFYLVKDLKIQNQFQIRMIKDTEFQEYFCLSLPILIIP